MKRFKFSLSMPKGFSKPIHLSVLLLTVFGVIMIISSSATVRNPGMMSLLKITLKELVFIVLSYFLMVTVARNYSHTKLRKYYGLMLFVTVALLAVTQMFPGANGAKAWIQLPGFTIQPSESAKVSVILIVAMSLGDKKNPRNSWSDLMTHPFLLVCGIGFFVLIFQRDLGSAFIIFLIALICLMVPSNLRLKKTQMVFLVLFVLFIFVLIISTTPTGIKFIDALPLPSKIHYMADRFRFSANPFLDRYDSSAQIFNGLAAFASGGLFGVGFGQGFLKYSFIYAAESDSILAIIVEELGVIFGFMPIVILYGIIMYQLMRYTFLVDSEKDKIILVGTLAYFFVHFLLNVGGVTAIIPLTGVPLLLISAGGSSRMAVMIAVGLAQNVIARHNQKKKAIK